MGRISSDSGKAARPILVICQLAIAFAAVGGLLLAPPANGQIALYPLTDGARSALPRLATTADRRLVARTGVGGGFVIRGERPAFGELLFDHGILALAVPKSGCVGDGE